MLVAAMDHRGIGIGRQLIDFAERLSRQRRLRAIQLELLIPRGEPHAGKEMLRSWYARRGYRLIHVRSIDETYPHLAPLLATPCVVEVHEKALHPHDTTAPRRASGFGMVLPCAAARRLAAGRSF